MTQYLSVCDPDRRMKFSEWVLRKLREDPNVSNKILFSYEANESGISFDKSIGPFLGESQCILMNFNATGH